MAAMPSGWAWPPLLQRLYAMYTDTVCDIKYLSQEKFQSIQAAPAVRHGRFLVSIQNHITIYANEID